MHRWILVLAGAVLAAAPALAQVGAVPRAYTPNTSTQKTVPVVATTPTRTSAEEPAGGNRHPHSSQGGAGGGTSPGSAGATAGAGSGALPSNLAHTGWNPLVPVGIGLALMALSGVVYLRQRRCR